MCKLVQIVAVCVAMLAIVNHMAMVVVIEAATAPPTAVAFKKNQILRGSDQMAVPIDDNGDDGVADTVDDANSSEQLSLEDQVRLLTKQMDALMTRRREDFKLLENNLKKSMRKNAQQYADADVQAELEKLR